MGNVVGYDAHLITDHAYMPGDLQRLAGLRDRQFGLRQRLLDLP
jgi:hypothetical protein